MNPARHAAYLRHASHTDNGGADALTVKGDTVEFHAAGILGRHLKVAAHKCAPKHLGKNKASIKLQTIDRLNA